jgi:CubicO group peptidase (beta-lactamase class C family)
VAAITVEVDPQEVGLDPRRLENITSHFQGYVDRGLLAGFVASVSREGNVAWVGKGGMRDRETGLPMEADTIFRIYSMTKPITSIAAMVLWEQGRFELTDEVGPILGCFDDVQVYAGGTATKPHLVRAKEPIRIWHLLTHTSGLTYGFQWNHPVDAMYRAAGYEWGSPPGTDLAKACHDLSALPLVFEPGSQWNYSMSTDVLGRVLECVTGEPLDVVLRRLVLDPLGMDETAFFADQSAHDRVAQLYIPDGNDGNKAIAVPELGAAAFHAPRLLSGGGGLVSTARDYARFTAMLARRGELDGVRIVSPHTIDYMTRSFLPDGQDLESFADDMFSETAYAGVGFGLGFAVVLDATKSKVPTTEGSYSWGGAASTAFWVDPLEGLEVSFFTQLLPSSTHPIRSQLSQLVYASVTD